MKIDCLHAQGRDQILSSSVLEYQQSIIVFPQTEQNGQLKENHKILELR